MVPVVRVRSSECIADGELKSFHVIAVGPPRALPISQGVCETESEQAERREPLHADARRGAQLVQIDAVGDARAVLVGELLVAREEGLPEVEEQAESRGARELFRQWQDGFELARY